MPLDKPVPRLPDRLSFLKPHVVNDLVRRGNRKDGGYVLPSSVLGTIDAVVSFGLSTDWSIEEDLARANDKLTIHVYDHSVGIKSFARARKNAALKLLGGRASLKELRARHDTWAGYKRFFVGKRVHFRERVFNRRDNSNDATIETIFQRLNEARHVFLKMDIEGGEYRVIPQIVNFYDRIDLMVIEFHDIDPLRSIFESQVKAILDHFRVIHLHGNNIAGVAADGLPECLEITFLSKRFETTGAFRDELPIAGLDVPNDPLKPDLPLHFR
jgi:hypothetical protein